MKRRLHAMQGITSVPKLIEAIRKVWLQELEKEYFRTLVSSMPKHMKYILKHKGAMSKY